MPGSNRLWDTWCVVTQIGHDYPPTSHLHARTALKFRDIFFLYIWSPNVQLIRRYTALYCDNIGCSTNVLLDFLSKPKNNFYVVPWRNLKPGLPCSPQNKIYPKLGPKALIVETLPDSICKWICSNCLNTKKKYSNVILRRSIHCPNYYYWYNAKIQPESGTRYPLIHINCGRI